MQRSITLKQTPFLDIHLPRRQEEPNHVIVTVVTCEMQPVPPEHVGGRHICLRLEQLLHHIEMAILTRFSKLIVTIP
jgi:hypothetical protein